MMNFEKYTNSSKKIINSAQNLALSKKHQKIAPIHIFYELLNSNHELINKLHFAHTFDFRHPVYCLINILLIFILI